MKPSPFTYLAPGSTSEALAFLSQHGFDAKLLAGGQSLIPALNFRLSTPSLLVDIGGIAELRGVHLDGGMLRIGALTRHADIMRDALVARHAPLMAEAVRHIAHPAIRNRGTLGGSLALADRVFCYSANLGWDVAGALAPLGARLCVRDDLGALVADIVAAAQPGDQVLVMSNGGFGGIHDQLLAALAA